MSLHPFPLDPGPGFCVSVCIRKVSDIFLFGNSKKFFRRIFREKFCGNGELCVTLQRLRREALRLGTTIVLWCNGSTTVFGSVCLGSNPGKTTIREEGNLKAAWPNGFFLLFCRRVVSEFYTGLSRGDIRDYLGLRAFVRADPTPPIYLIGILVCNFCADCAATGIKRGIKRAEIRTKCHK